MRQRPLGAPQQSGRGLAGLHAAGMAMKQRQTRRLLELLDRSRHARLRQVQRLRRLHCAAALGHRQRAAQALQVGQQ
jgi:hypothetical protein